MQEKKTVINDFKANRQEKRYYNKYFYEKKMVLKKKVDRVYWCFLLSLLFYLVVIYQGNGDFKVLLLGTGILCIGYVMAYRVAKKQDEHMMRQMVRDDIAREIFFEQLKTPDGGGILQLSQHIITKLPFYEGIAVDQSWDSVNGDLLGFFKETPLLVRCSLGEVQGVNLLKTLKNLAKRMGKMGITRAMVVTNGPYSEKSADFAKKLGQGKRMILIDGETLLLMAKEVDFFSDEALVDAYVAGGIAQKSNVSLHKSALVSEGTSSCFLYGGLMLICAMVFEMFYLYYLSALFLFALGITRLILQGKWTKQVADIPLWEED